MHFEKAKTPCQPLSEKFCDSNLLLQLDLMGYSKWDGGIQIFGRIISPVFARVLPEHSASITTSLSFAASSHERQTNQMRMKNSNKACMSLITGCPNTFVSGLLSNLDVLDPHQGGGLVGSFVSTSNKELNGSYERVPQ